MKKSRKRQTRRKTRRKTPELLRTVGVSSTTAEPRHRPSVVITTTRDIEFWNSIQNEKGQQCFGKWKGFLERIGFDVTYQAGSGYRCVFRSHEGGLHTIAYHDLHGSNDNKLPHHLAQRLWTDRLERHFNIILSAEGAAG